MLTKENVCLEFTCPDCGLSFASVTELDLYVEIHKLNMIKEVQVTQKSGPNVVIELSKSPQKSENQESDGEVIEDKIELPAMSRDTTTVMACTSCNLHFIDENELQYHQSSHRKYSCHICTNIFESMIELSIHHENNNSAGPPSNCKLCSFIGQTAEHLEQHIFTNHGYLCNQCDELFTCEDLLTRHTFNQHTLPVRIKCCLCDYVAVDKKVLDEHLTDVHNKLGLSRAELSQAEASFKV